MFSLVKARNGQPVVKTLLIMSLLGVVQAQEVSQV